MSLLPTRRGNTLPVSRGVDPRPNQLSRIDPWNDFDYMDRVFDTFFRAPFSMLGRSINERTGGSGDAIVELYESPEDLTAYVYAPGIPQSAFDIAVTDGTLTIKAERKPMFEPNENITSHTPYTALAASTGTFSASYDLPVAVDPARVAATYKEGVLVVKMPKAEAAKPKQIKIQVNNG